MQGIGKDFLSRIPITWEMKARADKREGRS